MEISVTVTASRVKTQATTNTLKYLHRGDTNKRL